MKKILILILSIFMLMFTACTAPGDYLAGVTKIMLNNGNINAAKKEINQFLNDFEQKVSVNVKSSDISKINNALANVEIEVSPYVIDMINIAKTVYNETGGAFNVCIYPVFKLYDFGKKIIPGNETIEELLPYTNINDLTVKENSVIKKYSKTQIDFGGISKGYAVDKCVEIAKKHGVTSGLINCGGELYIIDEQIISVRNPRSEKDNSDFCEVNLFQTSVATSGDYERYFILDGIRYCHIIDGKTGRRPDSDLISVSVADKSGALSDSYATALFVMGMDKAIQFSKDHGLKVILINEQKEYYESEGLNINILTTQYKVYE